MQSASRRRRVFVVGVGHTPFRAPGDPSVPDYPDLGAQAVELALEDLVGRRRVPRDQVQQAVCSYVYGDSTSGQAVIAKSSLGEYGIPVFNVNNNCASGSSALALARQSILSGMHCTLAVGFEKMAGLRTLFEDREHPAQRHFAAMAKLGIPEERTAPNIMSKVTESVLKAYARNEQDYRKNFAVSDEHIASVGYKNHHMSSYSPVSLNREILSKERIKQSRLLVPPLRMATSAPVACGAAAVILCDEPFVRKYGLQEKAVEILSQGVTSDTRASLEHGPDLARNLCGYDISSRAASMALREANISVDEIDLLELHDAFSSAEIVAYEAIGLCQRGEGARLVESGEWVSNSQGGKVFRIGKKWVVNPSGGLVSKGHPIGATGLAQCCEIAWQLRREAGKRQVPNARRALQHNYGWSSAAVVTIYGKGAVPPANSSL